MCDGRQSTDCDTMTIAEYERLVASETEQMQTKVNASIDRAISMLEDKRSELLTKIKADPRKSEIQRINLDLQLQTSRTGSFYIIQIIWFTWLPNYFISYRLLM